MSHHRPSARACRRPPSSTSSGSSGSSASSGWPAPSVSSGRAVPGPPLVVADEIDVLEALVRSGLPDGQDALAALLCDAGGVLLAVVHCLGDHDDTAELIALRLVDSLERLGGEATLASVWFAPLRALPGELALRPAEAHHLQAAERTLAAAGIECGRPVVMGPDGWRSPEPGGAR